MKKLNMLFILSILIIPAAVLSCKTVPIQTGIPGLRTDNGQSRMLLKKGDIPGIKKLSIISEVEGYRIVCSNNEMNTGEDIFIIESDEEVFPVDLKLSRNGDNLIIGLSAAESSVANSEEQTIRILVAEDLDVQSFENNTKSSSTDLRLSGIDAGNIDINTSAGSNYLELNNCGVNTISVNSDYGRSFVVLNQSEIYSELLLTGTPDQSKVLYYDKTAGAVHAEISGCRLNGPFNLNSVTGKIEVYAEDTVFSAPVKSLSTSGMHFYDLWDCVIDTDKPVEAVSDSGKIYFKFARHAANGRDFKINLNTGSEEIYFRIWGPLDLFRYDITTMTETGDKEFHSYEDFDTIDEGVRYRSKNHSEPLDLVTLTAGTESGKIYTRVVDCYKKLRFCGDYKTMRPLEPPF